MGNVLFNVWSPGGKGCICVLCSAVILSRTWRPQLPPSICNNTQTVQRSVTRRQHHDTGHQSPERGRAGLRRCSRGGSLLTQFCPQPAGRETCRTAIKQSKRCKQFFWNVAVCFLDLMDLKLKYWMDLVLFLFEFSDVATFHSYVQYRIA